jgi:hypothetical protein
VAAARLPGRVQGVDRSQLIVRRRAQAFAVKTAAHVIAKGIAKVTAHTVPHAAKMTAPKAPLA